MMNLNDLSKWLFLFKKISHMFGKKEFIIFLLPLNRVFSKLT